MLIGWFGFALCFGCLIVERFVSFVKFGNACDVFYGHKPKRIFLLGFVGWFAHTDRHIFAHDLFCLRSSFGSIGFELFVEFVVVEHFVELDFGSIPSFFLSIWDFT